MKRIGMLLVLGLSACHPIAARSAAPYPILLGPVDRIGGKPSPATGVADVKFDGETQNDFLLCVNTLAPTVSATQPSGDGGMQAHSQQSFAKLAGERPLASYNARLEDISAGAYVWFLAGCYEHKWWSGGDGHLEVMR
jgi:hypothetical protein